MHCLDCFRYLEESPANERFLEPSSLCHADIRERTTFHELENDPNARSEVVNLNTLNELRAVEVHDQAALVDDVLSFYHVFRLRELKRKQFSIADSLYFEHRAERTLS